MFADMADRPKNSNFSLPPAILAEFRRLGDVYGQRNKYRWAVASAAVLKLLATPEEEIRELVEKIVGAKLSPQRLMDMVRAAKVIANVDVGAEAGVNPSTLPTSQGADAGSAKPRPRRKK